MTVEAKRIPPIHQRKEGIGRGGAEFNCFATAMSIPRRPFRQMHW